MRARKSVLPLAYMIHKVEKENKVQKTFIILAKDHRAHQKASKAAETL
jgi:hypothetical protein